MTDLKWRISLGLFMVLIGLISDTTKAISLSDIPGITWDCTTKLGWLVKSRSRMFLR